MMPSGSISRLHLTVAFAAAAVLQKPSAQGGADLVPVADALLEAHVPSTDAPDARARMLLATARQFAKSPASRPLIFEARRLLPLLHDPRSFVPDLQAFLAAEPHGDAAQAAGVLQAALLRRAGAIDEALAIDAFASYARNALVIGPFGDSGDNYNNVVFPPELRFPPVKAKLAGRYGPVQCRLVRRRPMRPAIEPVAPAQDRQGCYYALHQVTADADVACYLEIFGASFEVFVNGVRTAAIDRRALRQPLGLRFAATLRKGHNHVLVKTTRNGQSEFTLRYVDGSGRPVPGVREADAPDRLRPHVAPVADAPRLPAFVDGLQALRTAAGRATGEDRHKLLLAATLTAFRVQATDTALLLLDEIGAEPPTGGPLALAHARTLDLASPLPTEIRQARVRQLVEGVASALPDHHYVILQRARYLADQDKREDAVRLLQSRVAAGAAGPETFDRLYGLLRGLRFHAQARLLVREWRAAFPLDHRPTMHEASLRARGGDARGALALLVKALETHGHAVLPQRALQLARDLGDGETALAMLQRVHALEPESPSALEARSTTLRALGQASAALDADVALARHSAATTRQLRDAADRLLRGGRHETAMSTYRAALDRQPSQHGLRKLLQRLSGTDELTEFARFRRDGGKIIAEFTAAERERGSPSSLVLDQMLVRVYADGSMAEEVHQIRRINDVRGVELHQEARAAAAASEVVALRTVGVDGKSYVPNRVAGNFSMPRLEPGAFVEEIYRNFEGSPAPGPWRTAEFHFRSTDEPFLLTEFVIILPEHHPGSFRVRNFTGETEQVELENGLVAHVFRRANVSRLPVERHVPPLADVVPVVTYGGDGHPAAQARRSFATAVSRLKSTPAVRAATEKVVTGHEGDSAVAQAIHDFVHRTIASGRGTPDPTAILLRGRGPRYFLQAAMLAEANVPFRHAAVASTRDALSEEATPLFAEDRSYRVPALRVAPRDGEPFWLFADTPRHAPMGTIPHRRMGAPGMLLGKSGFELIRIPDGRAEDATGFAVTLQLDLEEGGHATGVGTAVLRGVTGYDAADQMRNVENNVRAVVARRIGGSIFEGWTLRDVGLVDVDKAGSPLRARATVERKRALETAGEDLLLELPLAKSEFLAVYGDRGERQLPLRLNTLTSSVWKVAVDPGTGYRFTDIPQPVRVRHLLLEYSLGFQLEDGVLVIRREVVQRPGTIPPGQCDEWFRLLRRLDLYEAQKLKLAAR